MIEHPIDQPQQKQITLTDDLVEKAARLMNIEKNPIVETTSNKKSVIPQQSVPATSDLRKMLKEVVTEVLTENGILSESTQKTKEMVSIRVGDHVFEGQIHKIKKVKKQ